MWNIDDGRNFERMVARYLRGEDDGGRTAHHVLHRREREAIGADLRLGRRGVRNRVQVAAGVHHHACIRK